MKAFLLFIGSLAKRFKKSHQCANILGCKATEDLRPRPTDHHRPWDVIRDQRSLHEVFPASSLSHSLSLTLSLSLSCLPEKDTAPLLCASLLSAAWQLLQKLWER